VVSKIVPTFFYVLVKFKRNFTFLHILSPCTRVLEQPTVGEMSSDDDKRNQRDLGRPAPTAAHRARSLSRQRALQCRRIVEVDGCICIHYDSHAGGTQVCYK